MARQVINRGNFPNDHAHADSIYVINGKLNDMTLDLYSLQSQILSAGDSRFSDPVLYPTTESKIDAMLTQCEVELKTVGAVPANFIPYDTTLVGAHPTIRRVREGGDYSVYDILAYGADNLGILDCKAACNAAHAGALATHGVVSAPPGVYAYSGKIFDIVGRISIIGAGKRSTFFRPMASYADWGITITDCWRNGTERADDATVDLSLSKAGPLLEGFTMLGDRAHPAKGIATVGLVDFLRIRDVDFLCLNGTALQLGTQDSTNLGCVREAYFSSMQFNACGNASEPAFDIGGGQLAVAGDGTNDLTLIHMVFANNKGVSWRIAQTNPAESIRNITAYGVIVNGDALESASPTAADLVQITGNVGAIQLYGTSISGSTLVAGTHYASVRVASNAAGTPDRITIKGDIGTLSGDGYVIDGVTGMVIQGTSGVVAPSLELKVGAGAIGSYLQYDVLSNQSVAGRQALISIGDEAAASKITGAFRTGAAMNSPNNDTTPNVSNVETLILVNSGSTQITDFDLGGAGQRLLVACADDNTNLVHDGVNLTLHAHRSRHLALNETIEFVHRGSTNWQEVGQRPLQMVDGWTQDNVTASQTDVELTRADGRFRACRAGSVTGVVVTATEARTAGTLTIKVFANSGLAGAAGAQIGTLTAVLNGSSTSKTAVLQRAGLSVFAGGDEVYITVTTDAAWTPITSDIRCALEITA